MEIKNKILTIELVNWNGLKPLQPAGFKEMTKKNFAKLKESIVKNNFAMPFTVWKNGDEIFIIDGTHRYKALQELKKEGYKIPEKLPAVFIDCKDRKEASKLVILYSSIYATVTDDGLYEFMNLENFTFDELNKEFSIPEIDFEKFNSEYFLDEDETFDEDEQYNNITKAKTKRGDVYELNEHRLINADCTNEEEFKLLMNGETADMIFTDPPYGVSFTPVEGGSYESKKYGKIKNDDKSDIETLDMYKKVLKNLYKYSKNSSPIYWWFSIMRYPLSEEAFKKGKWHVSQVIIWVKNMYVISPGQDFNKAYECCLYGWKQGEKHYKNPSMNNLKDIYNLEYEDFQAMLDIWYAKKDRNYIHPTQKPVMLCDRALRRSSVEGDIILDPFAGSGSTLIACEQKKRRAFVCELDAKYCDLIVMRYINYCKENNKNCDIKLNGKKIDIKIFEN